MSFLKYLFLQCLSPGCFSISVIFFFIRSHYTCKIFNGFLIVAKEIIVLDRRNQSLLVHESTWNNYRFTTARLKEMQFIKMKA